MSTMKHIGSAKALGRVIRDRRKSLGLTQALAGKMVGVHQPTVSEVERGAREVKIDTLLKLVPCRRTVTCGSAGRAIVYGLYKLDY